MSMCWGIRGSLYWKFAEEVLGRQWGGCYSSILQITVLGLHWPMCMLFTSFVLSRVSMKEGRRKSYTQRTAKSGPRPSWWLEWSKTTPFPEFDLWHGPLKETFSYTLSFSQLNAELGSLDWFFPLRLLWPLIILTSQNKFVVVLRLQNIKLWKLRSILPYTSLIVTNSNYRYSLFCGNYLVILIRMIFLVGRMCCYFRTLEGRLGHGLLWGFAWMALMGK